MLERSLNPDDIINLLSKLKTNTPDYPPTLMAARKAALLDQVAAINFDNLGRGGKGGGDGGSLSSGTSGSSVVGGMSTAQGILLQAVIGVWIIAAMLTAAYVFRDQIIDLLQDYDIVSVEMTQVPAIDSPAPATEIPSPNIPPTEITSLPATEVPGASLEEETTSGDLSEGQGSSENQDDSQDNPGLHLGQTPGTPDTPNQDNPNKPDKPDKKNNE